MSDSPFIKAYRTIACLLTASVALPVAAEDEIIVGRTAAGQLKVDVGFEQPFPLLASVYPGITGYATGEVGLHSNIFDDPASDFFQLSTAADFRFILLAKDPGMEVWNDTGSGYLGVGGSFYVGIPVFDTHPIWNLVGGSPGVAYSLILKLHDVNGIYPDSAPVVLSFTPAVAPVALAIGQTASNVVTLSWSTNAAGWALESTAAVTPTAWKPVTNSVAIVGANFSLNLSIAQPQQYFRLRQQ
jgi:hypothetical protein